MNYSNHHAVFTRKVAGYDTYTCRRALIDCHDTLDGKVGEEIHAELVEGSEEPGICPACNGSGEGQHEGSRCHYCGGWGEA